MTGGAAARRAACLLSAAWVWAAPPLLAQDTLGARLGPGDLLRLRVLDWDGVLGEVRDWPLVSGSYLVGPDGAIDVPFAGRVEAAGREPAAVSDAVVAALRERLALVEPPDVTVDVEEWRPVIVMGDVSAPGRVDYAPGLLALQAVGIAGGTGQAIGDESYRRRESAGAEAQLILLRGEERRLRARQARLLAELVGSEDLTPPATGPEWETIIAQEQQLLTIRRDALAREAASLDDQRGIYEAQIASLGQKQEALERQRTLADEASANAEDLADRGLVANRDVFDADRLLADIESQLLDVSTAVLEAREGIARVSRERDNLLDARTAETLQAVQEVAAEIEGARGRILGQLAVLDAVGTSSAADRPAEPEVAVLRMENGALQRIDDAALLPLLPGDIVEVTRPSAAALALDELMAPADAPQADAPQSGGDLGDVPPADDPLAGLAPAPAPEGEASGADEPAAAPLPADVLSPAVPDAPASGAAAPILAEPVTLGASASDARDAQPMTEPPDVSPPARPTPG